MIDMPAGPSACVATSAIVGVYPPALKILANQLGITTAATQDLVTKGLLPAKVGLEAAAIPVRFQGSSVLVAFADPSDDGAIAAVTPYVESPALAVAELTHIEMLWRRVAA